jgi:hypothetical protein
MLNNAHSVKGSALGAVFTEGVVDARFDLRLQHRISCVVRKVPRAAEQRDVVSPTVRSDSATKPARSSLVTAAVNGGFISQTWSSEIRLDVAGTGAPILHEP